MADKPILFSGPMVRATLQEIETPGTGKTHTRRIIKPQPEFESGYESPHENEIGVIWKSDEAIKPEDFLKMSPYGKPGDLLWVRENFAITHQSIGHEYPEVEIIEPDFIPKNCEGAYWKPCYNADWTREETAEDRGFKWRPSIHMPRWINRITLDIKDIRVERLQDISEEDAIAEGIVKLSSDRFAHFGALLNNQAGVLMSDLAFTDSTARGAFALLWQSINGTGSWKENPWVWIVEFEAHQCNIDDFIAEKDRQYG